MTPPRARRNNRPCVLSSVPTSNLSICSIGAAYFIADKDLHLAYPRTLPSRSRIISSFTVLILVDLNHCPGLMSISVYLFRHRNKILPVGFEPTIQLAQDLKSRAYANSATEAYPRWDSNPQFYPILNRTCLPIPPLGQNSPGRI